VVRLRDGRVLSDLPVAKDIAGRHLPMIEAAAASAASSSGKAGA
jgi:hypothetical protein